MNNYKSKIHLGWFFILAVVIPSLILSVIAIRSVNKEEAYIEKQLQDTLLAEINHTVSLITAELESIQTELKNTARFPEDNNYAYFSNRWEQTSPFVHIPFFLSRNNEILWPSLNGKLKEDEMLFLKWNIDFFKDRGTTPVFENIAYAYKNEILNDAMERQTIQQNALNLNASAQNTIPSSSWGFQSSSYDTEEAQQQYAQSQFAQYEPIRKEVYKQAKEKGQQVSKRNIIISKKGYSQKSANYEEPEESVFIAEALNFSQIINKADSGIIPRFIGDNMQLLFWKKDSSRRITGCVINKKLLVEKLIARLPNIYSDVRVLTILGEDGKPLITPNQDINRDWRRPFIAAEISELLPRWEIAAYLTDPRLISSTAHSRALVMWVLIFILLISITSGGSLILKSLYYEMRLAQQKTTFAANVSHELKTPLTSIRVFTELLKQKRQPDEKKQEQYLDIMLSENEVLTRLINNILDFSRMEKKNKHYRLKNIDIVNLCRTVFNEQRVRLEYNGFKISFTSAAEHLTGKTDEEAVKQVILNLLSNAEKYSTENKDISIEIVDKDAGILINIKDRGIGISPVQAKFIFEEFYRADDRLTSKTRGTGLGLTIAQRIMHDLGGDIYFYPNAGGGSIFQIKIPKV